MKLKKLTIAFIAAISLIGTFSFNNEETKAASINTEAKKYKYSGVTYLYKILKLEGIKYNKFPGVEYQNGKRIFASAKTCAWSIIKSSLYGKSFPSEKS